VKLPNQDEDYFFEFNQAITNFKKEHNEHSKKHPTKK
jgi:hypothetical protein